MAPRKRLREPITANPGRQPWTNPGELLRETRWRKGTLQAVPIRASNHGQSVASPRAPNLLGIAPAVHPLGTGTSECGLTLE